MNLSAGLILSLFYRFLLNLDRFLPINKLRTGPANPFGGIQFKMLEFINLVYFWNLKANAVATGLAFLHSFFRYDAIKGSPWYIKIFVALILSWGFALMLFLGRVCFEILTNVSVPSLEQVNEAIRELDK